VCGNVGWMPCGHAQRAVAAASRAACLGLGRELFQHSGTPFLPDGKFGLA